MRGNEILGEQSDILDRWTLGSPIGEPTTDPDPAQRSVIIADSETGPEDIIYMPLPEELNYNISPKLYFEFAMPVATRLYSQTKGEVAHLDLTTGETVFEEQTDEPYRVLSFLLLQVLDTM